MSAKHLSMKVGICVHQAKNCRTYILLEYLCNKLRCWAIFSVHPVCKLRKTPTLWFLSVTLIIYKIKLLGTTLVYVVTLSVYPSVCPL